jgi:DNA-binding CsgD family transcriptional regulator
MQALAPHIRRAVTIGDLFDEERAATSLFRQLVDALSYPVFIVAGDMRILFANPAAESLLRESVIAQSAGGRLSLPYNHANTAVQRTIAMGVRDEVSIGSAGINVPLALAAAPAVAHVLPLARRDAEARLANNAVAGIFISIAGHTPPPAIEALASLFGLTAGEKRVVSDIADGKSRKDIALSRGVSDETIKTQLATIYDKTGTRDQRQLEHLIRDVTPPVATRQRPTH